MSRVDWHRSILALALMCGLATIASAPLWHHEHVEIPEPSQCSHTSRDSGARLHDATGPAVFLADACPICLSQRLLGQSDLLLAAHPVAPVPCAGGTVEAAAAATVDSAFPAEARGPPLS